MKSAVYFFDSDNFKKIIVGYSSKGKTRFMKTLLFTVIITSSFILYPKNSSAKLYFDTISPNIVYDFNLDSITGIYKFIYLQDSSKGRIFKSGWVEIRLGLVGGTIIDFPSVSIGLGGNYNTRIFLYSFRVLYNKELVYYADAPAPKHLWDFGFLIGKQFANKKRRIIPSVGIGYILTEDYMSTGYLSYKKEKVSQITFPIELKMFWIWGKIGWGFAAFASISSKYTYGGLSTFLTIGANR